jgi:hypothetical protein
MTAQRKALARSAILAVILGLVVAALPGGAQARETASAAAAAAPPPRIAAYDGAKVRLYALTGALRATRTGLDRVTLAPKVLAGMSTSSSDPRFTLVGVDPLTGKRLWSVKNASLPLAVGNGDRVLFGPDQGGTRDEQNNSIWIREKDGKVRKVVQFANGAGLPGYDPGFDGENGLLHYSVDQAGTTLAVAEGNDVDLFVYDVFAVSVSTGKVTRVTSGKKSRWPAVSADGSKITYQRETGKTCGAPYIRAAELWVASGPTFATKKKLSSGTCASWLNSPRWISPRTVVAYRTTRSGTTYTSDLVAVDVTTAKVKALTSVHDIAFASASPTQSAAVVQRSSRKGFLILRVTVDATTGAVTIARTTKVPAGEIPQLVGDGGLT